MRSLPQGWERASLRDSAVRGREGFIDGDWIEAPYITDAGIRLIQTGNIGRNEFIDKPETRKYISAENFRLLGCTAVNRGEVLICRLADPIGRACEVPAHVGDAVTAVDCTITRIDEDIFDKRFVLHWLNSEHNLKAAADSAAGSTRFRISRSNLGRLPLPRPPREEQIAIGRILDTLDTAIRQTEAIIEKLKLVKRGLLHDLLTRGIDDNGELRPPQSEAPHLYKESALGWIPKSWAVHPLSITCDLIRDGTHLPPARVHEGPPLLSVRNMRQGRIVLTDQDTRVAESFYRMMHKSWTIERGDVALAIVGATIGKLAVVGNLPPFTVQRSVAILRGTPGKLRNSFLYESMLHKSFQDRLWARVNQTAQPGIYLEQLGDIGIRIPPLAEQDISAASLASVTARIEVEQQFLKKAQLHKSGLMDDLLTGRVRVTPLLDAACSP